MRDEISVNASFQDYEINKLIEATLSTDIAKAENKVGLLYRQIIPFLISSYISDTQPLEGPEGYVFGLTQNGLGNDIVARLKIDTDIEETEIDFTNEAIDDFYALCELKNLNLHKAITKFTDKKMDLYIASIDAIELFTQINGFKMAELINRKYMDFHFNAASPDGAVTLDGTKPISDEFTRILFHINRSRTKISTDVKRGLFNYVIVTPKVAAVLQTFIHDFNHEVTATNYMGSIGNLMVFQDYGADVATNGEYCIVGYKHPTAEREASTIFAPYDVFMQEFINAESGQSSVKMKMREKMVLNPLDTGTAGASNSDFIRKFTVDFTATGL